jgi:ABC-2 type transport system permease protein
VTAALQTEAGQGSGSRSVLRGWCYLVWLSWQRQARARQMVWVALGLLTLSVCLVGFQTAAGRWGMHRFRLPQRGALPFGVWMDQAQAIPNMAPNPIPAMAIPQAVLAANRAILENSAFMVFSQAVVFLLFLSFLLPIWSLSFATEALGGERESQSLIWLLTRPLPRSAIYLGKFVATLPWCLALNLGGFALICLAAGPPGLTALRLFWPAVLWSSLTFAAVFYFMGAFFRRPAIVAVVYSFFLEVIMGNMPGAWKRFSVGFYARCMMFEAAETRGLQPENPLIYEPVSGTTAVWVLVLATIGFLLLGMLLFRRAEFQTND